MISFPIFFARGGIVDFRLTMSESGGKQQPSATKLRHTLRDLLLEGNGRCRQKLAVMWSIQEQVLQDHPAGLTWTFPSQCLLQSRGSHSKSLVEG